MALDPLGEICWIWYLRYLMKKVSHGRQKCQLLVAALRSPPKKMGQQTSPGTATIVTAHNYPSPQFLPELHPNWTSKMLKKKKSTFSSCLCKVGHLLKKKKKKISQTFLGLVAKDRWPLSPTKPSRSPWKIQGWLSKQQVSPCHS